LVVSKRFGRRRIAAFHAPKPFAIIGERERVDDRPYEASIASEAKIRLIRPPAEPEWAAHKGRPR
jgi:hypothetical protein